MRSTLPSDSMNCAAEMGPCRLIRATRSRPLTRKRASSALWLHSHGWCPGNSLSVAVMVGHRAALA
eukprot:5671591-Pyramimonas_sp.AAC.1